MQGGLISIRLPDASDSEQHEEEEWKNGQSFHSCKASILTKALPLIHITGNPEIEQLADAIPVVAILTATAKCKVKHWL